MKRLLSGPLAILILAGCTVGGAGTSTGPSGPGGSPPGAAANDLSGTWVLRSGVGVDGEIPLVDGHRITLVIQGDEAGGVAACNHYGGKVAWAGGEIRFSAMFMTEMACVDDGVMESEAAYLAALGIVTRWARDGDSLVLGGADVQLRFDLEPPPADEEIIGTTWQLESLISGEAVSSVQQAATLELRPDGSVKGSTGCRDFSGRYQVNGDEIVVSELVTTDIGCDPSLAQQDQHVLDVLGDGFSAAVAGPTLTLTAGGNLGLGYRATSAE